MADSQTDLRVHPGLDGELNHHSASGASLDKNLGHDEMPQSHLTDGVDTNDLFGGPGCDFMHELADDRSALSGDNASCSMDELAELPQRVQSPGTHDPGFSDVSPTLAREQHDAIFARCLLTNCDFSGMKMPWEVGIFRDIFSDEPVPQPVVPAMEISADCHFDFGVEPQFVAEKVAEAASSTSAHPVFAACVSCANGQLFAERRANLRDAAISKLLIVLKHRLSSSVTGRPILSLGDETLQAEGARSIVDAVVGVRSPATLVKRANSLLSFLRWFAHMHVMKVLILSVKGCCGNFSLS